MRLRLSILLLLSMIFSVTVARAQENEAWYWAIGMEEGTLYAYTPSGQINTLLESGVEPGNFGGWRLKPDSVLALLRVEDKPGLYHLTSDTAHAVTLPEELSEENGGSIDDTRMAALNGDFGVLVSTSPTSAPALLINLKTDEASWLTGEVSVLGVNRNNIVFSADGLYLRYLSHEEGRSTTWSILERKLETGDERVIHTLEADPFAPVVWTDSTGENWLYLQTPTAGADTRAYTLVTPSGIDREVARETLETGKVWGLLNDKLITFSLLCEEDCPVDVTNIDASDPQHYVVPEHAEGGGFSPLALQDNNDLILLRDSVFWRLSSDGSAEKLGSFDPRGIVSPVSKDNRWLLMYGNVDDGETPSKYQVWDVQAGKFIFTGSWDENDHIISMGFGPGGFILNEDALRYWLYRYSDGAAIELPSETARYFAVLADGTLLDYHFNDPDPEKRGIYHYDPVTGSETLLVPNAVAVNMLE